MEKKTHICKRPITMTCGHNGCYSCFKEKQKHGLIKCYFCEKYIDISENETIGSNELFDSALSNNLTDILKSTDTVLRDKIEKLKDLESNIQERLNKELEFVRSDLRIQVQLCKNDLDSIHAIYEKELIRTKESWTKMMLDDCQINDSINELEKGLVDLNDIISNREKHTQENVYMYQNKIKEINECIFHFQRVEPYIQLHFKDLINSRNIRKNLHKMMEDEFVKRSDKENFENINLENIKYINDICVLPNNQLLVVDSFHKELYLYDSNFKLINKIDKIKGNEYSILSVDTDKNDSIYLFSFEPIVLIKTDMKFHQITKFDYTDCKYKFGKVHNICYHDDFVYVCGKQCLLIHDKELECVYSRELDYNPYEMRCINNVACISSYELAENTVFFHSLKDLNIIRWYNSNYGCIASSNFCFYELYLEDVTKVLTMRVYNENGEILKMETYPKLDFRSPFNVIRYHENGIVIANKSTRSFTKVKI